MTKYAKLTNVFSRRQTSTRELATRGTVTSRGGLARRVIQCRTAIAHCFTILVKYKQARTGYREHRANSRWPGC